MSSTGEYISTLWFYVNANVSNDWGTKLWVKENYRVSLRLVSLSHWQNYKHWAVYCLQIHQANKSLTWVYSITWNILVYGNCENNKGQQRKNENQTTYIMLAHPNYNDMCIISLYISNCRRIYTDAIVSW